MAIQGITLGRLFAITGIAVDTAQPDRLQWRRMLFELLFNGRQLSCSLQFLVLGMSLFDWSHRAYGLWLILTIPR